MLIQAFEQVDPVVPLVRLVHAPVNVLKLAVYVRFYGGKLLELLFHLAHGEVADPFVSQSIEEAAVGYVGILVHGPRGVEPKL